MRWHKLAAAAILLACGGSAGTRPEDMSAAAHEEAAAHAEATAESHRAQGAVDPGGPRRTATGSHWGVAANLHRRAEAHLAAARTLRQGEAAACAGLADEVRTACPLSAHPITAVEQTTLGLRVTYAGAEPEALLKHARCHAAHGATEGHEGMPGCPLYQKDLRITAESAPGGAVLVLESTDESVRRALREAYVQSP